MERKEFYDKVKVCIKMNEKFSVKDRVNMCLFIDLYRPFDILKMEDENEVYAACVALDIAYRELGIDNAAGMVKGIMGFIGSEEWNTMIMLGRIMDLMEEVNE